MKRIVEHYAFQPPTPTYSVDYYEMLHKNGRSIPYFMSTVLPLEDPKCFTAYPTMIYSHGNASDIGMIQNWLVYLCNQLNVNVISYDYAGYGHNTHNESKCCEEECYLDIEAVYTWLVEDRRVKPGMILLWGTSLGSGPAVHLAALLCKRTGSGPNLRPGPLLGLILQSPLSSAVRVVSNKLSWLPWTDIFCNIDKISSVTVPVFIFHGDRDTVVPVEHGRNLYDKVTVDRSQLWILPGIDHNDIEDKHGEELIRRVGDFIEKC